MNLILRVILSPFLSDFLRPVLSKVFSIFIVQRLNKMKPIQLFLTAMFLLLLNSCYIYSTQEPALVKNVDIDQSLKVARDEMKKKDASQSLGIWMLRDQVVTPQQARIIADLYLTHIDGMTDGFNIWHSSWAIANLYRLGDAAVKAELEAAYQKAKKQPDRLEGDIKETADSHINGDKLVTGFIHLGGLNYAYDHLVVPGNKKYIQSYEEYLAREEK